MNRKSAGGEAVVEPCRVPGDVDHREVVEGDRVGLDGEPATLFQLQPGPQIEDGVDAELTYHLEVGGGEAVEAVGPEQPAPAGDPAIGGRVPPQVPEVVNGIEGDDPARRDSRHGYDGTGVRLPSGDERMNGCGGPSSLLPDPYRSVTYGHVEQQGKARGDRRLRDHGRRRR